MKSCTQGDRDDRERLSGLASMHRTQAAGELIQFLQALNLLGTSLPRLAEFVLSSPFECCWRTTWGKFNAGASELR